MIDEENQPYPKLQLLASLGESDSVETLHMKARILNQYPNNRYFLEMALTGVHEQENELLAVLFSEYNWHEEMNEDADWFIRELTEISVIENGPETVLSGEELRMFERGEHLYRTCLACHGGNGQGIEGVTASLTGSEWVNGDAGTLIRIMLHGFEGGAEERGEQIAGVMPGHSFMTDEEIAAISTYIRQSWGNTASPITAGKVREVRNNSEGRTDTWSPDELRKLID